MRTSLALIAVVAGPGLLLGCAAGAPTRAVDLAAEKAAVEQVLRAQLAATNQAGEAGAEGYVSVAAEDLVLLRPNAARLDGRKAVRDWSLQLTSATDWSVSWKADRIEVAASGDVAYAIGTYELSLKDANGNAVADKGKFLDAFTKQPDGSWRQTSATAPTCPCGYFAGDDMSAPSGRT
jgi:ketosteroid isomerase-like protein